MDKLLEVLHGVKPNIDFANETAMIDDGVLDSFDIISICTTLNNTYGIEIEVSDLEPENFNTVQAMLELIESLGGKV